MYFWMKRVKTFLEDVTVYRGVAGGMSDPYLVEAKEVTA